MQQDAQHQRAQGDDEKTQQGRTTGLKKHIANTVIYEQIRFIDEVGAHYK